MPRQSPRHVFDNLKNYEGSLASKMRLLVKNQMIKARTGSTCCGHPGEPGC